MHSDSSIFIFLERHEIKALESETRNEVPSFVIREALVNALARHGPGEWRQKNCDDFERAVQGDNKSPRI